MDKYLAWVKEHPLETGGIVIVIIGGVYLYMSSGSSTGSAPASTDGSAASAYYAAQLQAQQLAASQSAATAANQTQEYNTGLAATVQNNETAAQLAAIQDQDATAVQTAQIQANMNTAVTQLQADVSTSSITAQQQETDQETQAELESTEGAYGVQNNQIAAQVQQQQIAADVADTTTQAQVTENSDNLASVLGLVTSQNDLQESEYNDQLEGIENNNQTAVDLSGQQYGYATDELNDATSINLAGLTDQTQLETTAQNNQLQLEKTIIPLAGQQKNSALDANDQTSIFQTILSGGNAGVAEEGDLGSAASVAAGDNAATSTNKAIIGGASSVLSGLFA